MNLVLFTTSYPYTVASEQTFLNRELPYLSRNFERVVLVPQYRGGEPLQIPTNVSIQAGLAEELEKAFPWRVIGRALLSRIFYSEISSRPLILLRRSMLRRLVSFSGQAELARIWLERWIRESNLDIRNSICYTYWFNEITMGIGLTKRQFPGICLISRAHGYDVFEENYDPPYWPHRSKALGFLDGLFLVSNKSEKYMQEKYPEASHIYQTIHLGVEDPGFVSQSSSDGVLRIVSCSGLIPLKRVDLILEGIAHAARMRPDTRFEWHHFGEGKSRAALQKKLAQVLPPNAQGHLEGFIPNEELMRFYHQNPVDVFVNLSTTEGIPVTLMEAASCGIPLIATTVGGNPEIVRDTNGLLLNSDPTLDEVAGALLWILDNGGRWKGMRTASRRLWQEQYNATSNFQSFVNRIRSIRQPNK